MLTLGNWVLQLLRTQWLTILVSFFICYVPSVIVLWEGDFRCIIAQMAREVPQTAATVVGIGTTDQTDNESRNTTTSIQMRHWPVQNADPHLWTQESIPLTTVSGCDLASWVWESPALQIRSTRGMRDCVRQQREKRLGSASQLQTYDTLYVPFASFKDFVSTVLPEIRTNIILITGQGLGFSQPLGPGGNLVVSVHANPFIKALFSQNAPVYVREVNYTGPHIYPFGYGLKRVVSRERISQRNLRAYWEVQKHIVYSSGPMAQDDISMAVAPNKTEVIFIGPLGMTNKRRQHIPRAAKTSPHAYFAALTHGHYTFSPDGDRPECYRHYEALGMGTIPITEMSIDFSHLASGPVVYSNTVASQHDAAEAHYRQSQSSIAKLLARVCGTRPGEARAVVDRAEWHNDTWNLEGRQIEGIWSLANEGF
jgi:hypothetical protein